MYSPIRGNNNKIFFNVGVNAYIEVVTGKKPEFTLNNELPDLIKKYKLSDEFLISLQTELYYDKMNDILQEDLVGYEYLYSGNKKVVVTDASVYGNGDKLVVKISFGGNMKGDFFMTGAPKFDELTKTVYIDDLDFDLESKVVVLNAAAWLLKGSFSKQINSYLKFSLQEQVDDSMKMIQSYLKESQLDETIGVDCSILNATLNDIILEEESMNTVIDLRGTLRVYYGK